jgi:DHA3 family tetracycline resistance protein-like MFS transporter
LFAFALAGHFALALAAYLLASACRDLHYPLSTAWANQSIDSRVRATVLSMNSQVNAFGQVAGGPVVGLIGRNVSIRAALATSALILTPVLGLYARAMRMKQPAGADEESLEPLAAE